MGKVNEGDPWCKCKSPRGGWIGDAYTEWKIMQNKNLLASNVTNINHNTRNTCK